MPSLYEIIAERILADPSEAKDMRAQLAAVPELRRIVAATLIRGLAATRTFYSKTDGMITEPDFSAQNKAAALLLAYSEGLPMQSTVNLNVEAGAKGLSMADAMANSPALRDFMRAELAKADERKAIPS